MLTKLNSHTFENDTPFELTSHYVGNEWVKTADAAAKSFESLCPSTGKVIAVASAGKKDVIAATEAAHDYHRLARSVPFEKRIASIRYFTKIFKEYSSTLETLATAEQGKPMWEVRHEINACTDYLEWVSENGDFIREQLLGPARLGHIKSEFLQKPAGPTAAYLPFSTVISSFCFYYVAGKLSGCPLIMFSSKHNLLQAALLTSFVEESQSLSPDGDPPSQSIFGPGHFQMLFGGFSEMKLALTDRKIAAVLYTGSRDHCDEIREDSRSFPERRLILQSGGKNTAVVHSSANMHLAVNAICLGAFRSSGQLCSSTNRVMVHRTRLDEFSTLMKAALKKMTIGPTHAPGQNPFMGALYSEKAVERFLRYQTMAAREAEATIAWGKAYTPDDDAAKGGYFVTPGIHLLKEPDDTSYQKSVIFCPDIAVYSYDQLDDGIDQIANATKASFSLSFFGDEAILKGRLERFHAPNILHNLPTTEAQACLPLAGRYASGFHRFHGPSLAHYLLHPTAYQKTTEIEPFISDWPRLLDAEESHS